MNSHGLKPFNRVFFYDPVVNEESDLELGVCIFAIKWEAKKLLRVSQPYCFQILNQRNLRGSKQCNMEPRSE